MKALAVILPLLMLWTFGSATSVGHYKREGHSIMKRMADKGQGYEGHDVARVHLVEGQDEEGQSSKRLAKRDLRHVLNNDGLVGNRVMMRTLQLALSEGSTVNLTLKPADIVGPDTVFLYHTEHGDSTDNATDFKGCFFIGRVGDSSGHGWAAVSHCDGLFGFAYSRGYEYFLHPVEAPRRSKRDTHGDYDVHVMWRRSITDDADGDSFGLDIDQEETHGNDLDIEQEDDGNGLNVAPDDNAGNIAPMGNVLGIGATGFVIEMAIFSDARYCELLQYLYPGREKEFLLTKLAGVQSLYSNREKTGFDIKIRAPLVEFWYTNPTEYVFTQDFSKNLRSFRKYTSKKYRYDVHALNSGIESYNQGKIGLAYVGGACTGSRCMIVNGVDLDSFLGFAHELGHILGMSHHTDCPPQFKSQGGGFMGGSNRFDFSPCMKHQLFKFTRRRTANCLFKEKPASVNPPPDTTVKSRVTRSAHRTAALDQTNSATYNRISSRSPRDAPNPPLIEDIPINDPYNGVRLFPGQMQTPDGLCRLLGGAGYSYVPNNRPPGVKACEWFMCINVNESSTDYLKVRHFRAATGFPCKPEGYCDVDSCKFWNQTRMALDIDGLRNLSKTPEWSEWSTEFSQCSRSCGTGVRTRRRVCRYFGPSLAPYCPGLSVKPELCNTEPCPGDPKETAEVRQDIGDEVCTRFFNNGVRLRLKKAHAYLPIAGKTPTTYDAGQKFAIFTSHSCLLKCERDPPSARGDVDAAMPDGTPCQEHKRPWYTLNRLNVTLRCISGHCLEVSNCPDIMQLKDDCGICGGNGSRCVEKFFNSAYNVERKRRALLTVVPANVTNIDIYVDLKRSGGIVLELWSDNDTVIIGEQAKYNRWNTSELVEHAGTKWLYDATMSYIRAPGPLTEPIKVKYLRLGPPLKMIAVRYALP